MARTRTVLTLLLGTLAAALVLGLASVAAADEPANRGWFVRLGQEFGR